MIEQHIPMDNHMKNSEQNMLEMISFITDAKKYEKKIKDLVKKKEEEQAAYKIAVEQEQKVAGMLVQLKKEEKEMLDGYAKLGSDRSKLNDAEDLVKKQNVEASRLKEYLSTVILTAETKVEELDKELIKVNKKEIDIEQREEALKNKSVKLAAKEKKMKEYFGG